MLCLAPAVKAQSLNILLPVVVAVAPRPAVLAED
jgi:hypothetical protein